MMSFNDDFVHKYKLKNEATSNIKFYQVLSSLRLSDVGVYLRNGPFSSDIGILNLHEPKDSHWVAYVNGNYFDSYGRAPPQKLYILIIKRNGLYLSSEKKI